MSTQIHPDKRKKKLQPKQNKKKSFHQRRIFAGIIAGQRQKHSELGALGAGSAPLVCSGVEGDCSGDQSTCDAAAAVEVNFLKNRNLFRLENTSTRPLSLCDIIDRSSLNRVRQVEMSEHAV